MAYPNYFYPTMMNQPMVQNTPQTNTNNGITWVQGENAAKSYPVAAGQSVLLMDSEDSVMYIKSTDQSGMPLPLRIFEYTERKTDAKSVNKENSMDYVSRTEFNEFKDDIKKSLNEFRKFNKRTAEEGK